MIERKTIYFSKPGKENTDVTLKASKERAELLGINKYVVATNSGETALKCAELLKNGNGQVIAVTLAAGRWKTYCPPEKHKLEEIRNLGGRVLTATHLFVGNLGTAIRERFGGLSDSELIAQTLYRFSQGVKVAVEIAVMAADAALVSPDDEVIAIAGTDRGADTALVVVPAYSNEFFNLKVREIIAMPR
jgi:hypothetical protein